MEDLPTLISRATSFRARYGQLGNVEDLEKAISLDRNILSLRPHGNPNRSTSLLNLAVDLWTRYQQADKCEDLEESISLNREALTLSPPGHPHHSRTLSNLANTLCSRYQRSGTIEDLEECICLNRSALAQRPPGHSHHLTSLINLAAVLWTRYEELGETNDLEESISLNRETLVLMPPGHPHRAKSLNNLANSLRNRYEQSGRMDDLEESISLHRETLILCPPGHPERSKSLSNLSNALGSRYRQLGQIDDLEESISLNRDALNLCPHGHPHRSTSLNNLSNSLLDRYRRLGKTEDLDECVAFNHDTLALHLPGHPHRYRSLITLATAMLARYEQLGKIVDLDDSIVLYRDALVLCPPGHPHRFLSLINLANALWNRYEQSGKIENLEESMVLNRDVINFCPPGHPLRPVSLSNLAICLRNRHERLGEANDLEECILLNRDALTLRPIGHPSRFMSLVNLSIGLNTRHEQLGRTEDLEEGIALNRDALTRCVPGHPDRSTCLQNLAAALLVRYQKFRKTEDVQEMFSYHEESAKDPTSYLHNRLAAAIKWAEIARHLQHESMLDAYTIALQLLHRSLISRPNVEDQQAFLATAKELNRTSLASDAASAAIEAGNLELAVEFLEQGRAILWSKMDAYKFPLEQLRQVHGGRELADRLEILSAELEHLVLLSDRTGTLENEFLTRGPLSNARITRHRILSEEWETVVGRIREKPGFTYFLRTRPFDTLRSVAAEGPVILINISDYRSDAIILTLNNPPVLVHLSNTKPVGLGAQASLLTSNRGIISVLRYLWENIVLPVVEQLAELGIEEKNRIWWCPTAELCALPLHAAGPYRLRELNLADIYISSYTSTLSSLIRARSNLPLPLDVPKLLVVAQPHETLRKVEEEVEIIRKCSDLHTVNALLGSEASHGAVLDGLKQHSWVHFACHGHLGDDDQPFRASFELYKGRRLTLLELIQARLPNAESAFLAACHSAAGDTRTPDENIHLSAAMQFCGFRSVVGTLWEMYDEDAPMMSREFYKYMFRDSKQTDFRDSAYALSSAIKAMRKAKLPAERWVMFVHIGA